MLCLALEELNNDDTGYVNFLVLIPALKKCIAWR